MKALETNGVVRKTLQKILEEMPIDVDLMQKIVREVDRNYDLHREGRRTYGMTFTKAEAAHQIAQVLSDAEFHGLVAKLIDIQDNGYFGRHYNIPHLSTILSQIRAQLNSEYNPRNRKWNPVIRFKMPVTREIHNLSFLKIDIVGSTKLSHMYPKKKITGTYSDLEGIIKAIIQRRNGVIRRWEGDGVLASFESINKIDDKCERAVLSSMEIIHRLFMYNLFENRLEEPLSVRIAVDVGPCSEINDELTGSVIKRIHVIESRYTKPDSVTVSKKTFECLSPKNARFFQPFLSNNRVLYRYFLQWENTIERPQSSVKYKPYMSEDLVKSDWDTITPHKEYTFFHLYFELDNIDELERDISPENLNTAVAHFKDHISTFAENFNGLNWIWWEYGGIVLFPYSGNISNSVTCGFNIIFLKHFFDIEGSPFPNLVSFRLALHIGNSEYREKNTGTINSAPLNLACKLGKNAPPGSYLITEDAYRFTPSSLRPYFVPIGDFAGRNIYRMKYPVNYSMFDQ